MSSPLFISIPTSSDAGPVWSPFNSINGSATETVSELTVVVEPCTTRFPAISTVPLLVSKIALSVGPLSRNTFAPFKNNLSPNLICSAIVFLSQRLICY